MKVRSVCVWLCQILLVLVPVAAGAQDSLRAKGDQHRTHVFTPTGEEIPYRLYVPTDWDGEESLPILLFLHGAGANENSYMDMNEGQLPKLAEEHDYILVSPLGHTAMGAYGNPLRLPAVFGESEAAAQQRAAVTPERQRTLTLSELEVIMLLQEITEEYGADRTRTYLAGHSMGSGGAWHLAARYRELWRAVAPLSGPFIDRETYPFGLIRDLPVFITEGTGAEPSLVGSRNLRDWMAADGGFDFEYLEVDGNHGSMIPMVLPDIFDYFDRHQ